MAAHGSCLDRRASARNGRQLATRALSCRLHKPVLIGPGSRLQRLSLDIVSAVRPHRDDRRGRGGALLGQLAADAVGERSKAIESRGAGIVPYRDVAALDLP
jgi:hypothetical protein